MSTEPTARVGDDWHGEAPALGARLGRYELRALVGAGGMGVVFEALDPELDRAVAVKVLRGPSGQEGGAGAARLKREGVTMARLTHPNVIRVYDVGEAQGHVFVAMELVRGATLADWQRERTADEILAAYLQAGRGLAAAHDAGLVHRDFKPQNVLVGDDGRVLVTDFGLARAAGDDEPALPPGRAARSPIETLTVPGQIVGTPAYMAPEQLAGAAVDARADQYSFCIALLRALSGPDTSRETLAHAVTAASPGAATAAPLDRAAVQRVPARIRAALLQGLEAEPARRFASMHELLARLAPPAAPRWPIFATVSGVAVVAAVGAALVLGRDGGGGRRADPCAPETDRFAAVWNPEVARAVQAAFAATGRAYAAQTFVELDRRLAIRGREWEEARRQSCEATRVRREQSGPMMELRAACLSRRLDDLAAFVAELERANPETVDGAVAAAAALGDVSACNERGELARRAALPAAPAERDAIAALDRELSSVRAVLAAGRTAAALDAVMPLIARARRLGYQPTLAAALAIAGEAETTLEHGELARQYYEEAVLAAEAGGDDQVRFECEAALVRVVGYQLERDDEAQVHALRAEALLQRLGPDGERAGRRRSDPRRAGLLARHRATADWWAGRYADGLRRADEAVAIYEAADPTGVDLAKALHTKAILHDELGDNAATIDTERRAIAILERTVGAEHPLIAGSLDTLNGALRRLGRYDEARAASTRALAILEASFGAEHLRVALALLNAATIDMSQGRFADAVPILERALAIVEKTAGPEHSRTAMVHERLGSALAQAGRLDDGLPHMRRAIAIHTARLGRDNPATSESWSTLGKSLARADRVAEARDAFAEAVRALDASQGADSPVAVDALVWLGDCEVELRHKAAAAAAYRRALASWVPGADPDWRRDVEGRLARLEAK